MERSGKRTAGVVLGIVFLALCIGLYVYIYVIPSVTGALTPTAVAEYGEMLTLNEAECIVLRSERVFYANSGGNCAYYVENGDKTRHGVKVADIYPEGGQANPYYLESTATVSYWYDGLESTFTPDNLETITPDSFQNEDAEDAYKEPENLSERDSLQEGDPLYKVITGDTWYMALLIPAEYMDRYSMGASVKVDFGERIIDASIVRLSQFEDSWVVVASSRRYYPDALRIRRCQVSVITKDSTGLLIPTSARSFKEQEDGSLQEGVYVKNIRGEYNFKRIKVLAEDEIAGTTLVSEGSFTEKNEEGETVRVYTIGVYDEILRDGEQRSDVNISEEEPEEEEEEIVFEWEKPQEEETNSEGIPVQEPTSSEPEASEDAQNTPAPEE